MFDEQAFIDDLAELIKSRDVEELTDIPAHILAKMLWEQIITAKDTMRAIRAEGE
jgi:hypothetical protein